jgi:Tol biopolymer transport system component
MLGSVLRISSIAALIAGLVAASSGLARSEHVLSSPGGLIAYSADWSICAMAPDGSSRKRLTYSRFRDWDPAWAPEGRRLAFASQRRYAEGGLENQEFLQDIYMLDRGRVRNVSRSSEGSSGGQPDWSPDGQQLVVAFGDTEFGVGPLLVMNADGSGSRSVDRGEAPAWSPDGELIAYDGGYLDGLGLYVIRPDGSGKARLTTGRSPAWSPDGSRLAFAYGGIFVINRDGTGLRKLLETEGDDPVWSPDGQEIAFARGGDIWVMTSEGQDLRNLTRTPRVGERYPDWQSQRGGFTAPRGARGCGRKIDGTNQAAGDDIVSGPLDDLVYARAGYDNVRSGRGSDIVFGGRGGDILDGGPGRDDLRSGRGDDTIHARDGKTDHITCGPGRDVVAADRRDLVDQDCERVIRRAR